MPRKIYTFGLSELHILRMRPIVADKGFAPRLCRSIDELIEYLEYDPEAMGVVSMTGNHAGHVCRRLRQEGLKNLVVALIVDCGDKRAELAPAMMMGADDAQPLGQTWEEFAHRVVMLTRRSPNYIDYRNVRLPNGSYDAAQMTLRGGLGAVRLTPREDALLQILARHEGENISKEFILAQMYDGLDEPQLKIVDVFVCKLRKKLQEATGDSSVIRTMWGSGFRFLPEKERLVGDEQGQAA